MSISSFPPHPGLPWRTVSCRGGVATTPGAPKLIDASWRAGCNALALAGSGRAVREHGVHTPPLPCPCDPLPSDKARRSLQAKAQWCRWPRVRTDRPVRLGGRSTRSPVMEAVQSRDLAGSVPRTRQFSSANPPVQFRDPASSVPRSRQFSPAILPVQPRHSERVHRACTRFRRRLPSSVSPKNRTIAGQVAEGR